MNREELIEEATKESARRWPSPNSGLYEGLTRGFVLGATWAIEKTQCKRCGKIAEGYAFIGDDRYCHPDAGVDCYTLASHDLTSLANQAFIENAQARTDECECKRSAKKVSMSGGNVNKTADSLHVPTDDEREALAQVISDSVGGWNKNTAAITKTRDAILTAGFRRPAQTEPTDAQVERAARSIAEWNTSDVPLELCRAVARYALRAAFAAGQERPTEAQPRGKSCAVSGCRHAARWQDSGAVDYCACHYDDSAPDEECAAGQEEQS